MSNRVSERRFGVTVRAKRQNGTVRALSHAEPVPRLPRIRPCEVAAAAGLDAVRRALEDMLAEDHSAA